MTNREINNRARQAFMAGYSSQLEKLAFLAPLVKALPSIGEGLAKQFGVSTLVEEGARKLTGADDGSTLGQRALARGVGTGLMTAGIGASGAWEGASKAFSGTKGLDFGKRVKATGKAGFGMGVKSMKDLGNQGSVGLGLMTAVPTIGQMALGI